MKIGTTFRAFGIGVVLFVIAGCLSPRSFVKMPEPAWVAIAVRTGLTYDQAWDATVDYLVKMFNFEALARQDGYIRTEWLYTATGKQREDYRVRLIVKYSLDRTRVEIKSEAEYGGPDQWALGVDTRMMETVKTGLTKAIGTAGN
jgi:hypothetical protein